jgi:hypothetical protein
MGSIAGIRQVGYFDGAGDDMKQPRLVSGLDWSPPLPWYSRGLRIIDIANPHAPREVAHFMPDVAAGCDRVRSNDVTVDARGLRGHHGCFHVSRRLAVSEVRLALPNFNNITIRIANVAARLAGLVLWLCDKLGSSASP